MSSPLVFPAFFNFFIVSPTFLFFSCLFLPLVSFLSLSHVSFHILSHLLCSCALAMLRPPPSLFYSFLFPAFPLLSFCWYSQASALSDRRHRLRDESLRPQSSKRQTSSCGSDQDPGSCCSFSIGSISHIALPFISSICRRVLVCLSGRFDTKLWCSRGLTQVGCAPSSPHWPINSPGKKNRVKTSEMNVLNSFLVSN